MKLSKKTEPTGIVCVISIDRCSNIMIRPHSKIRVTLDTLEGEVSTDWSSSGNFGFQKSCTFADPLPDKLVFSISTKYSVESDFANRSVENIRREECTRELGWVEMPLHTLSIGFPQISGWYSIMSLSGESCGQIKLGLSPSVQTPRTLFTRTFQKPVERCITPPPPQRIEASNATLRDQLRDLDELIKTVKAKQTTLNEKRIELSDYGTQVTPSLSRMTPPKSRTPEVETPEIETQSEIIPQVSTGPRSDNIRSVPPIDLENFDQNSAISMSDHDSEESSEELNDIEPINSKQHIDLLSESREDPLSSTRLDQSIKSSVVDQSEEDSSEQNIHKMIDAFQNSCQSARQNLEEFQKLKNESENNQTEDELHNDTSVWNSTAESVEIEKVVEQVLDRTEDQTLEPEPDETIESEEEKETPVSAEVESSELDLLVMKSAITAEDIEEESIVNRPGLAQLTMEALNASRDESDEEVALERPDRAQQLSLNPKQTRRLAAIFGLK